MAVQRSDSRLVRSARRGDVDARSELVRRYGRTAWKAAYGVTGRRDLADEAAQDGLIRALGRLESYDDSRPFGPWLYRIVANVALRLAEREARAGLALRVADGAVATPASVPTGDGELRGAVLALPIDQREIVVLRYWADLGVDEIATVLEIPAGTVGSRLSRAIARLRESIGEETP